MSTIKAYTDGACRGNPGPGGAGAIIFYPETTQEFIYKEKSKVELILENENIKNLNVINPRDIFCSPNLCKYYSDSHYFYIDHIHFGYYGAEKIANHFVKNYLSESP